MFRNSILRYLNSAAVFDTDDAIARQRAELAKQVTVGNRSENEPKEENNENNEGNDDGNNGEDESGENNSEEDNDEGSNEQASNENETDEQKQARLAQEKEQRKQNRIQKRIDKIIAERDLAKSEAEALRKQLTEKATEGLSEEEVNRRAEAKAQELVNQRRAQEIEEQFKKDCNNLQNSAIKEDKEFLEKINNVAKETGIEIPSEMIGILTELDNENGGAVLAHLANDADLYEEITSLPQGRMTQRLIRISDKIKTEKEAAKKPQKTKVPDPIKPLNEGRDAKTANNLPSKPTEAMDEFVRIRNQQDAEKRKARGF